MKVFGIVFKKIPFEKLPVWAITLITFIIVGGLVFVLITMQINKNEVDKYKAETDRLVKLAKVARTGPSETPDLVLQQSKVNRIEDNSEVITAGGTK
jgi:hypothetical protein